MRIRRFDDWLPLVGKAPEAACLEPLLQAVRDREPEVQKAAIPGLKQFTGETPIQALIPLLRSHDAGFAEWRAQNTGGAAVRPAQT